MTTKKDAYTVKGLDKTQGISINAKLAALLVTALGLVNLLAASNGHQALFNLFPFSPGMSLLASLSFFLLGTALTVELNGKQRLSKLLCWLQLSCIPVIAIIHYATPNNALFNLLPSSAALTSGTFGLLGFLVLTHRTLPLTHIGFYDWLITCFSAVPLLSIFAYIFDPIAMYESYSFCVLPLPTAAGLILSFFALVGQTYSKGAAGLLMRKTHYARNFQQLFLLVLIVPLSVGSSLALAVDMHYLRAGFAAAIFCLFATLLIASVLANNAIVQEVWLQKFIREQRKNTDLQNHISDVLEISSDAILLINENLDVLHANQGAAELFGWDKHALQNISFGTLLPQQHFVRFERLTQRFFKSRRLTLSRKKSINVVVQNRLGEPIAASLNLSKRRPEGARHIVAVLRNNTAITNKILDLEQQLRVDALTGAGSRTEFENHCNKLSRSQRKSESQVAILILDLDNFKAINDTYGHPTGDRVLQTFSRTTQNCLRNGDQLFRIGGEEFAIVATQIHEGEASLLADRIRTVIKAKPMVAGTTNLYATCSIGVCLTDPSNIAHAIAEADKALYRAKRNGKDLVVVVE